MPEYFQNADILINAVPFGGLDKVVLEAMASGVIPLTSNSAFKNVFSEEIAENLIFEQNGEKSLKLKLKYILDNYLYQNTALTQKLREVVVKNHNLDNLISRLVEEISAH